MNGVLARAAAAGRRWCAAVRWWLRGVTGADAYDRYLTWCRRANVTPMDEKAFWLDQCHRREHNPEASCC